jgi:nucleoside-diphosphate-sugar epimerase
VDRVLVIGACGQIGVELTLALRVKHGSDHVIATDIRSEAHPFLKDGIYFSLDVMDREAIQKMIRDNKITQIYLLAAMLSATGEKNPIAGWDLNMTGLLNVLEVAKDEHVRQIFWPSSIAVFGPSSPKLDCPQHTIIEPTTVYGISKYAGECWCQYYQNRYGLDIRSIRYPGLISHSSAPGGGTTNYAVDIFHKALENGSYTCYLKEDTLLPMMYMSDAIRATISLMSVPKDQLKTTMSYNIAGFSFKPAELAKAIQVYLPDFQISYEPDYHQAIADSWPGSINDQKARTEWGWKPKFDLEKMVAEMLYHLQGEAVSI